MTINKTLLDNTIGDLDCARKQRRPGYDPWQPPDGARPSGVDHPTVEMTLTHENYKMAHSNSTTTDNGLAT